MSKWYLAVIITFAQVLKNVNRHGAVCRKRSLSARHIQNRTAGSYSYFFFFSRLSFPNEIAKSSLSPIILMLT